MLYNLCQTMKENYSYLELLDFITKEMGFTTQDELAKRMGFSPRTYYRIAEGMQPGKKIKRQIQTYMENNLGLSMRELENGKVQVIKKQVLTVHGDYYGVQGISDNLKINTADKADILEFLISKNMNLEKEITYLRDRLKKYEK